MLRGFIGYCYSVLVLNRYQTKDLKELERFSKGINTQLDYKHFTQVLNLEQVLSVFNAERSNKGLLLNYLNNPNSICYNGKIAVPCRNVLENNLEVRLPYLYLFCIYPQPRQFENLFEDCIRVSSHLKEQDILLLLYFLELNNYGVSNKSINMMMEEARNGNYYMKIVVNNLDRFILVDRGYPRENLDKEYSEYSPVQKAHLMFYLETYWRDRWNQIQGTSLWWQPSNFHPQVHTIFDHRLYEFRTQPFISQWYVREFISPNLQKVLLAPRFNDPFHLATFANRYKMKQCFNESFLLYLHPPNLSKPYVIIKPQLFSAPFQKITHLLSKNNSKAASLPDQISHNSLAHPQTLTKQNLIDQPCCYITILHNIQGMFSITANQQIIFSVKHQSKQYDHMCVKGFDNETFIHKCVPKEVLESVKQRRYNQTINSIQIRTRAGQSLLFYFNSEEETSKVLSLLSFSPLIIKQTAHQLYIKSNKPLEWLGGKISNWDYISWLNQITDRNYNDLSQYPIFPWTLICNQSELTFACRDLSKNMGSLGSQERISHFIQKYTTKNDRELFNEYHFGTHYLSSAIVFNYLIRMQPFSNGARAIQSGHYDCADRVFSSYLGSYHNATSSPTDIRQLVPEMYSLPEIFLNINNQDFGLTQTKERIDNVDLPRWASHNPYLFVANVRRFLESKFVSEKLHHWIDFMFGSKQRGQAAIDSMNLYYPLTYDQSINMSKVKESEQRISIETQIAHFGQNPAQIIGSNPHTQKVAIDELTLFSPGKDFTFKRVMLPVPNEEDNTTLVQSPFSLKSAIIFATVLDKQRYLVLRKHDCLRLKFVPKEDSVNIEKAFRFDLEKFGSIDYESIHSGIPAALVEQQIIVVGGFFYGTLQFLDCTEASFHQSFHVPNHSTIVALVWYSSYQYLYLADNTGLISSIQFLNQQKNIVLRPIRTIEAHEGAITSLSMQKEANIICSSGMDGFVNIYNLYTRN